MQSWRRARRSRSSAIRMDRIPRRSRRRSTHSCFFYKEIFEEYADVDVIPPSAGPPCDWASEPCFRHRLQHSGRHGLHRLPRVKAICTARSPWRCCPACGTGQEPAVLRRVHRPPSGGQNVELLWHCGPFAYLLKKPRQSSHAREPAPVVPVSGTAVHHLPLRSDDGHYHLPQRARWKAPTARTPSAPTPGRGSTI